MSYGDSLIVKPAWEIQDVAFEKPLVSTGGFSIETFSRLIRITVEAKSCKIKLAMGFTINEEITTKLHYKDIALIAVAMGEYQRLYKETADKETIDRMRNLVNRLGNEMADCPQDDNDN